MASSSVRDGSWLCTHMAAMASRLGARRARTLRSRTSPVVSFFEWFFRFAPPRHMVSVMSETREGAPIHPSGWWKASDGKWYPPEQQPGVRSDAELDLATATA